MNWLESLTNAIGAKIAAELKAPAVFGDLAKRMYDRNGNTIYATDAGRQILPINSGLVGFHWCLSSEVKRSQFIGLREYALSMQFVMVGPAQFGETVAFDVAEAIGGGYNLVHAEVGSANAVAQSVIYDLPTILGSHFAHLQEQILQSQLNLFAVEVGYLLNVVKK